MAVQGNHAYYLYEIFIAIKHIIYLNVALYEIKQAKESNLKNMQLTLLKLM